MFYDKETFYIIELLNAAVHNTVPACPPADINWDYVCMSACRHKIASTMNFAIQKLPARQQELIGHREIYTMEYKKAIVSDANRDFELTILTNHFKKRGIDFLILKGSTIKHLYPNTAMRPMNDVDILYRGSSIKDITKLFYENGYHISHSSPKDVAFAKDVNHVCIEMHTYLVDKGYKNYFEYLSDSWDKAVSVSKHEYKMTNEDFYIYHIIHMAKHFKHSGIGLTHILDVWVMMNSWKNADWNYIHTQLSSIGLKKFNNIIQKLVLKWFDGENFNDEIEETLDIMRKFIFSSGAFGVVSQKEANAVIDRGDKKVSLIKKIFPDKTTMSNYYGLVINDYPMLIPFFWARLNLSRIFRRKHIKTKLNTLSGISKKQIDATRDLMDKCGLK